VPRTTPPTLTDGGPIQDAWPGAVSSPLSGDVPLKIVQLDTIPVPQPGPFRVVSHGPSGTQQIAITIDDGFCPGCADAYVTLAENTGIHLTMSPNGTFSSIWSPLARRLRGLIEIGQVQIGNHTYSHSNLLTLSDSVVRQEIQRNEQWIEDTFGITARPWFRPPYGYHNDRTDALAASLGYTSIVMWNGSFGDSTPISPQQLLSLADRYLKPGTVMLGHANYPTIEPLWSQIATMISQRGLQPVTLDEMFGTSRQTG
jgi:peptidoglycan/xylan/chitin deacetylase (PgdA/CDA1 family)